MDEELTLQKLKERPIMANNNAPGMPRTVIGEFEGRILELILDAVEPGELSSERIYDITKEVHSGLVCDSIDTTVESYSCNDWLYIHTDIPSSIKTSKGDKVKVLIIKE